jgi:hypothetical protein
MKVHDQGDTAMTKHTVLLKRISGNSRVQIFESDDDLDYVLREKHKMLKEIWEEMGCPDEITVTVEPGDLLNV